MKIVINKGCVFDLSDKAIARLKQLGCRNFHRHQFDKRNDPRLVQVVEELKAAVNAGTYCDLRVISIPDDVKWGINRHEGSGEWIYEKHRVWC